MHTEPMDPIPGSGRRPRVLVLSDWYAPGYRAGGPIRSAVHFSQQMECDLDICVLTTDRDHGCDRPYDGIAADKWVSFSRHRVYYASPSRLGWTGILSIMRDLRPDHLYLNSMFSRNMTIYPLLMHRLGLVDARLLLAPRGMLMDSAMAVKPFRKRLFLRFLKLLGIPGSIRFQATNDQEAGDIRRRFGPHTDIVRLDNLPGPQPPFSPPPFKEAGHLRVVFVGRSHPIKNLDLLLRAMAGVRARIDLTIVMSEEDAEYARQCRDLANALPDRHSVRFLPGMAHEEIEGILGASHIFALPTRGENFGHAIYEALAAGRPVMVSDQTPWRGLEAHKAGWDLAIGDHAAFREKLDEVAAMDHDTLLAWCRGAWVMAEARQLESRSRLRETYLEQFS